jgi:hypothetical protein
VNDLLTTLIAPIPPCMAARYADTQTGSSWSAR